ncbi:hypothetical protein LAZ67_4002985 [Cordylochernes scorpioides]|uniref:Mos1 transposase HTH domain-containing protein n=1 Tax=Cordylochernes scorpioides TaxID=51811 RepID=A0ABY6KDD6_9ARAC|nr:hypothetical protein LAZ67_4002985 [Cordylochernes scorpioides]
MGIVRGDKWFFRDLNDKGVSLPTWGRPPPQMAIGINYFEPFNGETKTARLKMEYPGGKNQYFRHLLFFAFHRGQRAAEAARDICNVYGKGVIEEPAAQKWFAKFRNVDLDIEDTLEADDHQNSIRNI